MKHSFVKILGVVFVVVAVIIFLATFLREVFDIKIFPSEPTTEEKPVVYVYPEEVVDVRVEVGFDGVLTHTYPAYPEGGWRVRAYPGGRLVDGDGRSYDYLFWEGESERRYSQDVGTVVAGEDTEEFLRESLATLGLSEREANEFIVYWLPRMEDNAYNVVTFQEEAYTESVDLRVSPEPETMIRVFMTFTPVDAPVDIPPQHLTPVSRHGYTVVEWGGAEQPQK